MKAPVRIASAWVPRIGGRTSILAAAVVLVAAAALVGGGVFLSRSEACQVCHAMQRYVAASERAAHPALRCGACHASTGALAVVADGARMTRMAAGALTGRRPSPTAASERRCLGCHREDLVGVQQANGIAVRHADFSATRCAYCHGGIAHEVPGRTYKRTEMDDCLTCHRVGLSDVEACSACHVDDSDRRVQRARTAWRVTHGPEWRATHGLGDLDTCSACHRRDVCAKCHGVQIPHPEGWDASHGTDLAAKTREKCTGCHEPSWCEACHGGVQMPHPPGFLRTHFRAVDEHGYATCMKCHLLTDCEACHVAGAHRSLPGISPHGKAR